MKTKRIISILTITVIMTLALSACGVKNSKIEDYEWKMKTIIHTDNNQVVCDAISEKNNSFPEAKIIEMTLVAKDGKITISDVTNNAIYEGSYAVSHKTPKGTEYYITIENESGYAGVAMTTYADGSKKPTLLIALGKYSMYFYAD